MQTALSLLLATVSLLTSVNNNHTVSPILKSEVEQVATQAIIVAQEIIGQETTTTSLQTPVVASMIPTITPVKNPSQSEVFGSTECIPDPVLDATTTVRSDNEIILISQFSDGCNTQSALISLPYSWSVIATYADGSIYPVDSGVINEPKTYDSGSIWFDGNDDYHIQNQQLFSRYDISSLYQTGTTTVDISVGSTTAEILIP